MVSNYGCCNKRDKQRFQVNRKHIHQEFKEMMQGFTIPEEIWQATSIILQELWADREKINAKRIKRKKEDIAWLEQKMDRVYHSLTNTQNLQLLESMEKQREKLNQQKEELLQQIKRKKRDKEKSLGDLLIKTKKVFTQPQLIRNLSNHEIRKKRVNTFFGWKLYYSKEKKFRTPGNSLYDLIIRTPQYASFLA